jgi:hypothetical protein
MSATPPTITVLYPAVVDGELTHACDTWPRERVIAKLDGSRLADQLRADPNLAVVALAEVDAIELWLGPERFRKLGEDVMRLQQ